MKGLRVRLTKKFADMIDGIDLSRFMVGQILKVTQAEARLLIAEGWAEPLETISLEQDRPARIASSPIELP